MSSSVSGLYQPCFTAVRGSSIPRQTHEYALAVKGGVSGGGRVVRIGVGGRGRGAGGGGRGRGCTEYDVPE